MSVCSVVLMKSEKSKIHSHLEVIELHSHYHYQ